jgi:hypothetical protein
MFDGLSEIAGSSRRPAIRIAGKRGAHSSGAPDFPKAKSEPLRHVGVVEAVRLPAEPEFDTRPPTWFDASQSDKPDIFESTI